MIVKVDEIREGGLELEEDVPAAFVRSALEDARGSGFRADSGLRLLARFEKVGSGVLLDGRFTLEAVVPCRRCVTDVRLSLPATFTLNLVPRQSLRAGSDGEDEMTDDERADRGGSFRMEDAEQETYDGKVIDLDPILREQILLALPMNAPTCREDCKGLCGMCGQNLNEQACGCDPHPPDPRFAALKHIKLN